MSRILLFLSMFFVAGIMAGSLFSNSRSFVLGIFVLGLCLSVPFFPGKGKFRKSVFLSGILIFVFGSGILKYSLAYPEEPGFEYGAEMVFEGIISEEPESGKIILREAGILAISDVAVAHCDKVRIKGIPEKPRKIDGFDYPGYLAKEGIFAVVFYPEIDLIGEKGCSSALLSLKNGARSAIHRNLPRPHSSILAAMLLGDKKNISAAWQERLSMAGVRHITAVSGIHVTVLAAAALGFFSAVGVGKRYALFAAPLLVVFFIALTGFQPSAIRAGVMGGCAMIGKLLGRPGNSFRLLMFAAIAMLFANPLLLSHDIGFQLSFSAAAGILAFSPFFERIFGFLPGEIGKMAAMSFSANLFSIPLLGYYFNEISLAFPVANLLILPVLYWIMILGIVFLFGSAVFGLPGMILSFPLWILLTYLVAVVGFFSSLPWVMLEVTAEMLVLYILALIILLKVKTRSDQFREELNMIGTGKREVNKVEYGNV